MQILHCHYYTLKCLTMAYFRLVTIESENAVAEVGGLNQELLLGFA